MEDQKPCRNVVQTFMQKQTWCNGFHLGVGTGPCSHPVQSQPSQVARGLGRDDRPTLARLTAAGCLQVHVLPLFVRQPAECGQTARPEMQKHGTFRWTPTLSARAHQCGPSYCKGRRQRPKNSRQNQLVPDTKPAQGELNPPQHSLGLKTRLTPPHWWHIEPSTTRVWSRRGQRTAKAGSAAGKRQCALRRRGSWIGAPVAEDGRHSLTE